MLATEDVAGWPVKLTDPVFCASSPAPAAAAAAPAASASSPAYYHGGISKEASEGVCFCRCPLFPRLFTHGFVPPPAAILNADLSDGSFLLRDRVGAAVGDNYVLSVVYRGRPTHHLIARSDAGTLTINNKETGAAGLPDVRLLVSVFVSCLPLVVVVNARVARVLLLLFSIV